jgi:hypothetical protein
VPASGAPSRCSGSTPRAFAASHVLGDVVGAWPAVALVAGVVGLGAWLGADLAPARRRAAVIG